jgi:hypothetical protein
VWAYRISIFCRLYRGDAGIDARSNGLSIHGAEPARRSQNCRVQRNRVNNDHCLGALRTWSYSGYHWSRKNADYAGELFYPSESEHPEPELRLLDKEKEVVLRVVPDADSRVEYGADDRHVLLG